MKTATLFLCLTVGGCSSASGLMCSDDIHAAAMKKLWQPLLFGRASNDDEAAKIVLQRVPALSAWADGLPDRCARWAYLDWIEYAKGRANETLDPALKAASQKSHEAWAQTEAERALRTHEAEKTLPDPPK